MLNGSRRDKAGCGRGVVTLPHMTLSVCPLPAQDHGNGIVLLERESAANGYLYQSYLKHHL